MHDRIYADDLAVAAVAAVRRGRGGRTYNIADGAPGAMSDYVDPVAEVLELSRPPRTGRREAASRLPAAMLSFIQESHRLVVTRMPAELEVPPRYPDFGSAIAASLRGAG